MNPRHPNDEPLDPGQVYALVDQSVASDMEVVLHDLSTATVPLVPSTSTSHPLFVASKLRHRLCLWFLFLTRTL
ncbi:hypothetical protein V6N13_006194 [Hibiscus sabdariffa]